mmetsp:Transcript_25725/g.45142  ORF Transcript_25725/g.45142 Transcript_25725/m.45142 type:complete len:366 (+) Transcript_25725:475-1572(+)
MADRLHFLSLGESSDTTCAVCDGEANYTGRCGKALCSDCISTYLELKITEGQVVDIGCLNHSCSDAFKEVEVMSFVNEDLKTKFVKFKTRQELKRNAYLRFCPRADCEGYDIAFNKRRLMCNLCTYEYCAYCSEAWHGNSKCKAENDAMLDNWAKKNKVRYCPSCHMRIEKEGGCNHMTCSNCKYEFCWLCGQQFANHECKVSLRNQRTFGILVALACLFAPFVVLFCIPISTFVALCEKFDRLNNHKIRIYLKIFVAFPVALLVLATSPGIIVGACMITGIILPYIMICEQMTAGQRNLRDVFFYLSFFAFIPGIAAGVIALASLLLACALLPPFGLIKLIVELIVLCCRRNVTEQRFVLAGFN